MLNRMTTGQKYRCRMPGKMSFQAKSASLIIIGIALLVPLQLRAQQPGTKKPKATVRVDVDLVVVKASVTDPLNRYVTGLSQQHFQVFEDSVEQQISHFAQEEAPISVGIIFDVSGSMKENIVSAKNSVMRFLQNGNRDDEFFLVTFNQQTAVVQDFTRQSTAIQNEVALRSAGGRTAVYDATYLGLEKMKEAQNDKKALIIITDGEDNSSRYTFGEVKEYAKELDIQIYAIGERGKLGYGTSIIQDLVSLTGGRAFFPNSFNELDYYCDLIHAELRNQYILAFSSSNKVHDGKWRKLRVKLKPPEGLPRLHVRTKEGYYAPKS
jgi:Ca-activated chloride channel homolog